MYIYIYIYAYICVCMNKTKTRPCKWFVQCLCVSGWHKSCVMHVCICVYVCVYVCTRLYACTVTEKAPFKNKSLMTDASATA